MRLGTAWRESRLRSVVLVDGLAVEAEGLLVGTPLAPGGTELEVSAVRRILGAPTDLAGEIEAAATARAAEGEAASVWNVSELRLGPPVPDPEKLFGLGLNFAEHISEAGLERPEVPVFFAMFANSLVGPSDPIRLPGVSRSVDYEGELGVVIGRRAKHVTPEQALEHVGGYTVVNDVSSRDLQLQTSQWIPGKIQDTFAPMGPAVVAADHLADPRSLELRTRLNGREVQAANTGEMIFSAAEAVAHLSTLLTLEPGDVIAMGSPSGVGFGQDPPAYLDAGDVVEVEIAGIGCIRNEVVD